VATKKRKPKKAGQKARRGPRSGTAVIWPQGLMERWGIGAVTIWRMERDGRLPPRDFFIAKKPVGWRIATITAIEAGSAPAAA
jgi:predicted DNA-binding transcriptional regulator AlpA